MDKNKPLQLSDVIKKINKNIAQSEESKNKIISEEESALLAVSSDGKTRGTLTLGFLWGFFLLIAGCFLFVFVYNSYAVGWMKELNSQGMVEEVAKIRLLELDKVLGVIIGALGTSLGFIIGYYFKDKQK